MASRRCGRRGRVAQRGLDAFSLEVDDLHQELHARLGRHRRAERCRWDPKVAASFRFGVIAIQGCFAPVRSSSSGTSALANTCPADDAAIDSQGRMWAIFNSYSSIQTYFCAPGELVAASNATMRPPACPRRSTGRWRSMAMTRRSWRIINRAPTPRTGSRAATVGAGRVGRSLCGMAIRAARLRRGPL